MNRFLKHWRKTGRSEAFRGHVISYADDFVILCRGHAVEALAWTKAVMTKLGLTLNETKTKLRDARTERFDFLGYTFGPYHSSKNGRRYLGVGPSKKSVGRLKTRVREILVPNNLKPWPEVGKQLNALVRGWAAYFSHGTRMKAYRVVDNHVEQSVRHFLRRRHKVQTQGFRRFPGVELCKTYGVLCLRQMHLEPSPLRTPAWTGLPNDMR
jgi:RNA-directed DNA polymerase